MAFSRYTGVSLQIVFGWLMVSSNS